jgi:hypothetical protein
MEEDCVFEVGNGCFVGKAAAEMLHRRAGVLSNRGSCGLSVIAVYKLWQIRFVDADNQTGSLWGEIRGGLQ